MLTDEEKKKLMEELKELREKTIQARLNYANDILENERVVAKYLAWNMNQALHLEASQTETILEIVSTREEMEVSRSKYLEMRDKKKELYKRLANGGDDDLVQAKG